MNGENKEEKQEQRGYEGFCRSERFLMSKKPHRQVVKRRPHSQAFELSKALPCTHGQTYVLPSPHPPPHKSFAYTIFVSKLCIPPLSPARSISSKCSAGENNAWNLFTKYDVYARCIKSNIYAPMKLCSFVICSLAALYLGLEKSSLRKEGSGLGWWVA